MNVSEPEPLVAAREKRERWQSLDALRGFDMLFILGVDGFFIALAKALPWAIFVLLAQQMQHAVWHGFRFYDLIFPLFIFVSGAALVLSEKNLRTTHWEKRWPIYRKAMVRLLILCVLGVFYNHGWGTGLPTSLDEVRFASVLQRIGVAWFFTAMIVWHLSLRWQIGIAAAIAVLYAILQCVNAQPGGAPFDFSLVGSFNTYIDSLFLFGASYKNLPLDPEGVFSHIPAIINGLAGYWCARYIKRSEWHIGVLLRLVICAAIVLALGFILHAWYPINKTLWTIPFVLVSVGASMVLLLLFYVLIDVWQWRRWCLPFIWVGVNAIAIYMLTSLMNWSFVAKSLFGQWLSMLDKVWQMPVLMLIIVALQLMLLRWMYRKGVFIHL